jgi:hypothetical protein
MFPWPIESIHDVDNFRLRLFGGVIDIDSVESNVIIVALGNNNDDVGRM